MAATITIQACTGSNAGTENTVTGVMMRSNDSHLTDKNNPITIPTGATIHSYEKWLRWKCTVAPSTQCTNFKYWGPNTAPGTGLLLFVGTTASGATPVNTDSAVATTQQDTTHYSLATALSISGTLTTIGNETNYLVMQLDVANTAGQGDIAQQTHNYSYDEN